MPSLRACLETLTWQTLKAITRAHQLQFRSDWTKVEIRQRLLAHLGRPGVVRRLGARLAKEEREALAALLAHDGCLPYASFSEQFGCITPYRPWRPEGPSHPWRRPASPAEHLYFLGFIHYVPGRAGEDDVVTVPGEFKEWLRFLRPPQPCLDRAEPPFTEPAPLPLPNLTVTILLALCQRESIRPLHGRWLAPRWLAQWAGCLPIQLGLDGVRSERMAPYLAFMHYLAEAAGLLSLQAGLLKASPAAWEWLHSPAGEQCGLLWQGWLDDLAQEHPLWTAYRLPAWREIAPSQLRNWVDALPVPSSHGDHWYDWLPFARGLELPVGDSAPAARSSLSAAWALFEGPLCWLGIIKVADASLLNRGETLSVTDQADSGTPELAGRVFGFNAPVVPSSPAPAAWHTDTILSVPFEAPSMHWFELLQFTTGRAPGRVAMTPKSVVAALQAGWDRVEIERALVDVTGAPISSGQREYLTKWEADAHRLTLGWKAILSSPDRRLLAEIAGESRNRPFLGETLSRHHVQVNPNKLGQLVRRLRRQGYSPWIETATAGEAPPLNSSASLWLALRSYQLLGRFIRLPLRPFGELLQRLERDMTLEELAAVQFAVQQIEEELRLVVDGYTPALPIHPNAQTDQHLAVIQTALEIGDSLLITYLDAGSGRETARMVDPYRLEKRGGLHYLAGYCHLRNAERLFRVDRILSCETKGER